MRTLIICLAALVFILTAIGAATTLRHQAAAPPKRVAVPTIPVADTVPVPARNETQSDNKTGTFEQEAKEAEQAAKDALDAARRYADKLGENLRKKVDQWGEQAGEALAEELDALQQELNGLEQRLDELEKEYEQEQEREQPMEKEGLTTI